MPPADPFHIALSFTLAREGGFVDDPQDAGGATNRGITESVYTAHRLKCGLPPRSVRGITEAEMENIYRGEYWLPAGCQAMPLPLAVAVFDLAVNGGVGRAKSLLAKVPITGAPKERALKLCAVREAWYRSLHRPRFEKGWLNRVAALRALIERL